MKSTNSKTIIRQLEHKLVTEGLTKKEHTLLREYKEKVTEAPIDYEGSERMEPGIERKITSKETPYSKDFPAIPKMDRDYVELISSKRFKDSVDFIGWYIYKTNKILRISKKDAYRQYLAYYKGWGDYKNYSKDKKAIIYAKSVKDMANKYRKQLTLCKKNLDKNKYIIF